MKLDNLFEKRSHPELNPKISREEILEKYKDRDDIFISYVSKFKVGVNPKSEYDTPIGIYTYPLKRMYNQILTNKVPFAGHNKYLAIIECGIAFELRDYNNEKWRRDVAKLTDWFEFDFFSLDNEYKEYLISALSLHGPEDVINDETDFSNLHIYEVIEAVKLMTKGYIPGAKLWYVTNILSGFNPKKWNALLRKLGYRAIYDNGDGIIHENEPTQCVLLDPKAYEVLEIIENIKPKQNKPIRVNPFPNAD
jgi:hypothetical protein